MAHEEIVIKKGEGVKFGVWEDKTFAASDSEIHAPRYFKDYEEFGDTLQKFEGELILKDLLTKEMYDRFKDDKTALGVTFDKCIKGGIDKVALVQSSREEQPAPSIAELLEAMGDASALPPMAAPVALVEVQARGPRGPPQLPGPGHVYGFDEDTQLRAEECDQWQHSSDGIGGRAREPAEFANGLLEQLPEPDRLGMLHPVLDPLSEEAAMQRMLALNKQDMQTWKSATPLTAPGSMPEVQALLASDQAQQEALSTMPQKLELTQDGPAGPPMSGASDPFRPYSPEAPLWSMQGADMELAGVLGGQAQVMENAALGDDAEDNEDDIEVKYDQQTAQVASILHRYMERTAGESRKITLDDLIPPSSTDKEVAARTFLAVLTLATAGDFRTEQLQPYGPISVLMP